MVGVLTPLVVLLVVVVWTTEDVDTTTIDGSSSTVVESGGPSPWVPATVALLALPVAGAAWWWAGRSVALHERVARAVEDRRQLVEDASHQLRTPIAVLLTNADVTLAAPDASVDQLREALQSSRETAAAMRGAVEDLLDEARDRRRLGPDGAGTDLVALAAHVAQAHADQAAAAGATIRRTGPGRLVVPFDESPLERAIDAIVDNAVRHSPAGGEVVLAIADGDAARFSVTDQGPGIDPAHHADVFHRYWTTGDSGSGLGLAIAAEAARDGFTITIDSPLGPDGGTTVTLTFPPR
jgi:signal transduction histidine kinase